MAFPLLALVAAGTTLAAAGASASQSRSAAANLKREADLEAKQSELQATQREADRKERLIKALASQNAAAGAKGIAAFEGSPLTIMQEDIRREQVATERDQFGSQLSALSTRFRGRTKASSIKTQANINLVKAAGSTAGALQ